MTKDDDQPAASGREQPKRVLAHPARKTAPAGTPYNRFPPPQPEPLVVPAPAPQPERPPSTAQNTTTSPRTVGGHTARLLRGAPSEIEEEDEEEDVAPSEPTPSLRAHAPARSAQPRPVALVAPVAPAANVEPASSRGGTIRMDAVESPPVARKVPAAPPPPLSSEPMGEEPPSTARGGSARDFHVDASAFAGRPIPSPAAVHSSPAASPLSPVATSVPMGEITITASELEASVLPPEGIESRWPFAFAVGAVSLAIGSLLPLPFRQYIVPHHAAAAGASSAPGLTSAPALATADVLHTATPPPRVTGAAPPTPTFVPAIGVAPTAASTARPAPFGSVKVPRPNPTTPKDIF